MENSKIGLVEEKTNNTNKLVIKESEKRTTNNSWKEDIHVDESPKQNLWREERMRRYLTQNQQFIGAEESSGFFKLLSPKL